MKFLQEPLGHILLLDRSFRALEIRWPRWAELVPEYASDLLRKNWVQTVPGKD